MLSRDGERFRRLTARHLQEKVALDIFRKGRARQLLKGCPLGIFSREWRRASSGGLTARHLQKRARFHERAVCQLPEAPFGTPEIPRSASRKHSVWCLSKGLLGTFRTRKKSLSEASFRPNGYATLLHQKKLLVLIIFKTKYSLVPNIFCIFVP